MKEKGKKNCLSGICNYGKAEYMLDRERLSAITDNVVYDEPMSKHTTFRIGGTADAFVSPENALEIEKLFIFAKIPIHRI